MNGYKPKNKIQAEHIIRQFKHNSKDYNVFLQEVLVDLMERVEALESHIACDTCAIKGEPSAEERWIRANALPNPTSRLESKDLILNYLPNGDKVWTKGRYQKPTAAPTPEPKVDLRLVIRDLKNSVARSKGETIFEGWRLTGPNTEEREAAIAILEKAQRGEK